MLRAAAAGSLAEVQRRLGQGESVNLAILIAAVHSQRPEVVTAIAATAPALVNLHLPDGWTALYAAAHNGDAPTVACLLNHDALVDQTTATGVTPLFACCLHHGCTATMAALLAAGADATVANAEGATPLYAACQNGQLAAVDLLLGQSSMTSASLHRPKATGSTPLYVACQKGHWEIAERLLAKGAAVDARTNAGASPLVVAALQGHVAVVALLLRHNADPVIRSAAPTTRQAPPLLPCLPCVPCVLYLPCLPCPVVLTNSRLEPCRLVRISTRAAPRPRPHR